MNFQDLQQNWQAQNHSTQMVVALFKESRQNKVDHSLKRMVFFSILFMAFQLVVTAYTWLWLVPNMANPVPLFSAIALLVLSYIVFFKNVWQLNTIAKIDHSKPVVEAQRLMQRLKVQRIRHNRFIFIFSNLYFWLLVALIFDIDYSVLVPIVWENAAVVVVVHAGFAILWFPLSFWLLRRYDKAGSLSNFWKKMERDSYLTDASVNSSMNRALAHLDELKAFEEENE